MDLLEARKVAQDLIEKLGEAQVQLDEVHTFLEDYRSETVETGATGTVERIEVAVEATTLTTTAVLRAKEQADEMDDYLDGINA